MEAIELARPTPNREGFRVDLDTGTENPNRLNLFESWITLWCQRNCSGEWSVEQIEDRTKKYQFVLCFSDSKEAVHFKLVAPRLHVKEATH